MNGRIAIALATVLVATACSKAPQDEMSGADVKAVPTFGSLDTNVDGSLTPDEAQKFQQLAVVFSKADSDSDGKLSVEEYDDAVQDLIPS